MKKHFALLGALALPGFAWADCVAPSSIGGIRYVIEAEAATPAELEANPWQFDADGYLIWQEGMPEWTRGARRIDDLSEFLEFDPMATLVPLAPPRKMGQGKDVGDPALLGCGDDPVDGERVEVRALRVGSFFMFHGKSGIHFVESGHGSRIGGPEPLFLGTNVHTSPIRMGCAHDQSDRTAVAASVATESRYSTGTTFAVGFTSRVFQVFEVLSVAQHGATVAPYSTCFGEGG